MTEVYLALGANVGNKKAGISNAIKLLTNKLKNVRRAPLYTTKPVGYTKQADFLNTAISGQTDLSPRQLLKYIKEVERQVGRVQRLRWGPREIDIDIIFYGDVVLETSSLTIPHPRFRTRDFVLQPLADLNPELVDPLTQKTVSQLLGEVSNRSLR
jgi:2-amino-4-hydroxy-6-hydroxymethyldihydropteridine diphosphokinase